MKLLCLASALLVAACAPNPAKIPGPAPEVSRQQAIAIARTYQQLAWKPAKGNILHGADADGVLVHTPDLSLTRHGYKNGWWKPAEMMRGMPYQWGGFDTPSQFLKDLKKGHAAGDIATLEKRQLDDAGTSRHACGIDCSGFISRCWRLKRHHSTDELPHICTPLSSVKQLRPGDIMLNRGHVLLFLAWDSYRAGHMLAYESTPNPTWRVNLGSIPLSMLEAGGYRPWRYRQIRD